MTTSLPVQDVYECVQRYQALILLSPITTESKVQRGLLFVLDLMKNRMLFAFKIAERSYLSNKC